MANGNSLIVDVAMHPSSPPAELKGEVKVSRGMLEFRADPESPFLNPAFQKGGDCPDLLRSGGRVALSGKTLKELGYHSVHNAGCFKELADAGLETEAARSPPHPPCSLPPRDRVGNRALALGE
jgi:hypothetical protein